MKIPITGFYKSQSWDYTARMEPIVDYLKRRLNEVGPSYWEAIAHECGVAKTLPRKIAYGDRENPGVLTVQPLWDFFQGVDRGDRKMLDLSAPATSNEEATHAV